MHRLLHLLRHNFSGLPKWVVTGVVWPSKRPAIAKLIPLAMLFRDAVVVNAADVITERPNFLHLKLHPYSLAWHP